MATVQELLRAAGDLPGESPRRDVEILLGHCLGKPRSWLYTWPEHRVEGAALASFRALFERRRDGEPVAHLVGSRDFWTLSLQVDASTLIPRPETEALVSWALELPLPASAAVLDLGTGTGAIALALASERPGWHVTGVERSAAALELAQRNARHCGLERVRLLRSDWFSALAHERFDLIVGNPPYIAEGDPHLASGDVRFEPAAALVAAQAGLADLRAIVSGAPEHLHRGGQLLLEHGFEQGEAVRELLRERGFTGVETRRDAGGNERVTGGGLRAE